MRWYAGFLALPLIAVVSSCLGPTEIRITITSNACDKLTSVEVYVGGNSLPVGSSAATQGCTDKSSPDGDVGSLVIVPSGSNDESVHIDVVGSLVAGACNGPTASGQDCIVARRALSFSPHTPLDVPIFLDSACAGFCTDPTQTCVVIDGTPTCKDAVCDGDGGVSCKSDAGPPLDGSIVDGFPFDVSTFTCTNDADAGKPLFIWSQFTATTDLNVSDDNGTIKHQLDTSTSEGAYMPGCGNSLKVGSSQILAAQTTQLAMSSFTVAFIFRASTLDGDILSLIAPGSTQFKSGFIVSLSSGLLQVSFGTNLVDTAAFIDSSPVDLITPHTFVMQIQASDAGLASTIQVWRDGKALTQSKNIVYAPASDTLNVGAVAWIDDIAFYK